MQSSKPERDDSGAIEARTVPHPFARTLERQIDEIMSQVAPRRQQDDLGRGVVTVLFVTISGFTALCEELKPPEIGAILDVYITSVADSARKFLGTVQSMVSDTIMATWNAEYPQVDHALLAVNSAIDMVERVDDVNARLRMAGCREIGYGVGANTGDALVRRTDVPRRENDVIGDTVNVARLLSLAAPACGILIGEGTHVSIGDQIVVKEAGFTRLPGKTKDVRVYEVVRRAEGFESVPGE